ncbi:hypothetical protein QJS66_23315 (plasmid) [Kocuria rhizophila]|nr:hypothetical protein QJS66_23315 [Kocuria rhizophila]
MRALLIRQPRHRVTTISLDPPPRDSARRPPGGLPHQPVPARRHLPPPRIWAGPDTMTPNVRPTPSSTRSRALRRRPRRR